MEDMYERIGNVLLNLKYYKGSDEYSDGEVEDELLDIVKNEKVDISKIIYEKKS